MSAQWKKKTERSTYWVLRFARWGALTLGRRVMRIILYIICFYYMLFAPRGRRYSKLYLGKVLHRKITWKDCFKHYYYFSSIILDRVYFLTHEYEHFDIKIHGLEELMGLTATGKGLILLGAHLGSFDVLRALALRHDLPLKALMHIENSQQMIKLLHELNPKAENAIINMGAPESMLEIQEWLNMQGVIGILADRVYQENKTVTEKFLGDTALFSTGPFRLIQLMQVPVMFFCGIYLGGNRYEIYFEKFKFSPEDSLEQLVAQYVRQLEFFVKKAPYNWFNFYDYWKKK